jgi:lambda family phage minor tail protein L
MSQIAQIYGRSNYVMPLMSSSVVGQVSFGGIVYRPVPLELSGVQTTTQGAIPRPKVKVPNIDNFCQALMGTYKDLIRTTVTRKRTFRRFLDGQPEADPSEYYGPDIWRIDRVANASPESVTFELASPLDIQGKKLPGRQIIRDVCTHSYRTFTPGNGFRQGSCPYAGAAYYDNKGQQTGDPAADECGRSFTDCTLRYPYPQVLPTRAFPGSVRNR